MEEKERLDVLIYKRGLSASREKASSQIMSGIVYINGVKIDKPGTRVPADSEIEIRGAAIPYVSRGGLKLEKALREFNLQLQDKIALDIGASTGGFTDCMLQNGAKKVYAIDVGYGQLAWSLRTDSRVVCMERTNIRYVTPVALGEQADFASIDVSFISLAKVLPAVKPLLKENGEIVCLIKPQFEAGRDKVGKKGVVRDKKVHIEVIERILAFAREGMELSVQGLSFSPIKGPEGNIEYLLHLSCEKDRPEAAAAPDVNAVVAAAHELL
ncbi:MAG TPA: TlyA family RNA methyltransferase [Clostridia bacterium]|nr:TlyA family RNA methyltransferase [Clostridia bacterium]